MSEQPRKALLTTLTTVTRTLKRITRTLKRNIRTLKRIIRTLIAKSPAAYSIARPPMCKVRGRAGSGAPRGNA